MDTVLAQLLDRSAEERLELIEVLWDSLDNTVEDLPVPDWQKEDLARRKAGYLSSPESVVSWDEAKSRVLDGRR